MRIALRETLAAGGTLTGTQCFTGSPVMVEAMAAAGLDFTVIDLEHSPTTLESVAHLARAAEASGIAPLVRIPALEPSTIGRVMDLGLERIVLPHASAASCEAALRAMRYPPDGERGACPVVRGTGYLTQDWAAHASRANREAMLVPLVEDEAGVAQLEAIFSLDGVEFVFLGVFDLSVSMGLAGSDYREPRLGAILDRTIAIARSRGKHVMTTVGASLDLDYAASLVARGVRVLSFSADVAVFLSACRRIAALREISVEAK